MLRFLLGATAILQLLLLSQPEAKAQTILGGQNFTGGGDLLTLSPAIPGGNQPLNIQCVICGDHQPQQSSTFGYTNYQNSGNLSNALFFSTNVSGGANPGVDTVGIPYDGSFLRAYLLATGDTSLTFSIGVDVNDTGGANGTQVLESFYLLNLTQHTVLAAFSPGPGGTPIPSQNNGTGFPDYTLTGFDINIGSDIQAGDQLIFFARISNQTDGPDSFFLIPTQNAVPGPLAGAGIPGLLAAFGVGGFMWRRRKTLA
jgi:hypothetical protein